VAPFFWTTLYIYTYDFWCWTIVNRLANTQNKSSQKLFEGKQSGICSKLIGMS